MKQITVLKAALSAGLIGLTLFSVAPPTLAADGKIIARCQLIEKSIVKTVGFESKAREMQWQVSNAAKKYPWVQAILASDPDRALPATELAAPENSQKTEKAVLATMQFIKENERPFSGGKVALGDVVLAINSIADIPVRYAVKMKNGKVLITRSKAPEQPTVRLTYNMSQ